MHVVVFANGNLSEEHEAQRYVKEADRIVCVDGGARHVQAIGMCPHVLIGDMDSVSPELRTEWEAQGVRCVIYPTNKDETDLELALLYLAEQDVTHVTVLGALGGRVDHELANVLLLAHPRLVGIDMRIVAGSQELSLIRQERVFDGAAGDWLSLLPIGGDVFGVTTSGLEYPLHNETLHFGPARGVSNVFTDARPGVCVRSGLLLAVHTHSFTPNLC